MRSVNSTLKGRSVANYIHFLSRFRRLPLLRSGSFATKALILLAFFVNIYTKGFMQSVVGNQNLIQLPISDYSNTNALLSLPDDYNTNSTQQYPLIIFLHGSGEAGTNISQLLNTALPQRIANGMKMQFTNPKDGKLYKFIVVSPQAPSWSYQYMHVKYMLPAIQKRYRVDASRIYITGLSAGGYGVWTCITDDAAFCDKLAAIVPISAAPVESNRQANIVNAAKHNVAVWDICGMLDNFWSVALSYTGIINAANPAIPALLTGLPGIGHSAWNEGYDPSWKVNGMNVYEWMLQFSKGSSPTPPPNKPPVANAGNDITITLPQNNTTLDGSASTDGDGSITAYKWAKTDGPSQFTLSADNTAKVNLSNLVAGTYSFQLTVTDNQGATGNAAVHVTVLPSSAPPVANAGSNVSVTLPQNSVTLDGSSSSAPAGNITSYQWVQKSGPAQLVLAGANTDKAILSNLSAGTYVMQLTVTDNNGKTASSTVQVNVNAAPSTGQPGCKGKRIYLNKQGDNGIYINGGRFAYQPGDTLVVKAGSNPWSYISLENIYGTATCPVTIINEGGQVSLTNGFAINNSRYIKLTGTGSNDKYGFHIQDPVKGDGVAVDIFGRSSNVEVSNIDIYQKTYGFWVKQDGSCIDSLQYPKWVINNISLHDNHIAHVTQEGMYLGSTDPNGTRQVICNGVATNPKPLRLGNVKVYNNIIDSTWRSGIQLSSASEGANEIYNNHVTNSGFEINTNQGNGISLGGYTSAYVHDNYIENTYALGILVLGAGNIKIDHNTIINSGRLSSYTVIGMDGIMVDTRRTDPVDSSRLTVTNNTIKNPTGAGVRFYKSFDTYAKGNIVCNNTGLVNIVLGIDWSSNCAVTPNKPPVANAGKDISITLPQNSVTLDGSASSDPDGSIAAYQWNKVSGPDQFNLTGNTTVNASLGNLVAGVYAMVLKITDDKGATATDTVKITVLPAQNKPPVANAGKDVTITLPQNSATLDGSASSDPGGSIASYLWTKLSGPAQFTLSGNTTAKASASNLVAGTYVFVLKVTDNQGATATDTARVTVLPAQNKPPVANAGKDVTISLPQNSATLDGSASSDPDGSIASYLWTKLSGPAQFTLSGNTTAKASASNLVAGTYVFVLKVTDNQGATATDTARVTVLPAQNKPPVANAGKDVTMSLPQNSATLDGSASSDPDGSIASYLWTKLSGPAQLTLSGNTTAKASASNLVAGTYVFVLKVTDNQGATATDTARVTVLPLQNKPPVANAGKDITLVLPNNSTVLNGTASTDPDGKIVAYQWSWQSGPTQFTLTAGNTANAGLSNLVAGTYVFVLKITDDKGATSTATTNIKVVPDTNGGNPGSGNPPPGGSDGNTGSVPPVANAGADIHLILPANSTTLNGSSSTTTNGSIVSYQWNKLSGPGQFTLTGENKAQASLSNLVAGVYVMQLAVTDSKGLSAKSTVSVTVTGQPGCAGKKIYLKAGADKGIYLNGTRFSYQPGDTLVVKGGPWSYVSLENFYGTATCPVTIINEGGQISLSNGFALNNCRYIKLAGTGGGTTYGFHIQDPGARGVGVDIFGRSSNIEVCNIDIYNKTYGFWVKQDASCIDSLQYPKWTISHISIHDNRIVHVMQEGMYLGSTDPNGTRAMNCNGSTTYPKPLRLGDIKVYSNIIDSTWRTGIQLSSASGGSSEIYNNRVTNCGFEINSSQGNGISLGGYTRAYVHDNFIQNTYATGIVSLGSGTIKIDHNTISNSGRLGSNTVNGIDGIMVDTRHTAPVDSAKLIVTNNTISNYTGTGVRFYKTFDTYAKGNIVCNNTGTVNIAAGIDWSSNCVVNQPPVARAGSDIVITAPQNSTRLDGSASSDAAGYITHYRWAKISGPNQFTIVADSTAATGLQNLVTGVYQFELTVTDNNNLSAKDTVQVTVSKKLNLLPVAVIANKDTTLTLPANSLQLNGSSSMDPDGQITGYKWSVITGPPGAVIQSPDKAATGITGLTAGVYVFALTVTDNSGGQASARITVIVVNKTDDRSNQPEALKSTIYPNPVHDVLNVQLAGKIVGKFNLSVFDAMGHVMLSRTVVKNATSMVETLNVQSFGQGTYFLVIFSQQEKTVLKFIKYK